MKSDDAKLREMIRFEIESMHPGSTKEFTWDLFEFYNPPRAFPLVTPGNPIDNILESISGSAYEFYWAMNSSGRYGVHRLLQPYPSESRLRTFVSADRLDLYDGVCGRYWPKGAETHWDQSKIPLDERVYCFLGDVKKDFPWTAYPGDRVTAAIAVKEPTMAHEWPLIPDRDPFIYQQYELRVFRNVLGDRRPEMDFFKFVKC